jgi:hypothetical protein
MENGMHVYGQDSIKDFNKKRPDGAYRNKSK